MEPVHLLVAPACGAQPNNFSTVLAPASMSEEDLHTHLARAGDVQSASAAPIPGDHLTLWGVTMDTPEAARSLRRLQYAGSAVQASGAPVPEGGLSDAGLDAWRYRQTDSVLGERVLQRALDVFMTQFDAAEAAAEAAADAAGDGPDADGFIKVSRKKAKRHRSGHRAVSAGAGAELSAAAAAAAGMAGVGRSASHMLSSNAKRKLKRGNLEKTDFYRFQRKEARASRLTALQAAFEADRAKVAAAKAKRAQRKFK